MDNDTATSAWFVATRAVHFVSCLLALGVFAFDRFVVTRTGGAGLRRWWEPLARRLVLLALPAAAVSGAAWFALAALDMSGLPAREAVREGVFNLVWRKTQFGVVWQWRSLFWVGAAAGVPFASARLPRLLADASAWVGFTSAALLTATLAWTGHGRTGPSARLHLFADVAHLLACGFWPAGLLPLALVLFRLKGVESAERRRLTSAVVRRFSAASLASVALLAGTGVVNSRALVGTWANLFHTPYGRLLAVKVAVFLAMVGIGAVNLLWLKPGLSGESLKSGGGGAARAVAHPRDGGAGAGGNGASNRRLFGDDDARGGVRVRPVKKRGRPPVAPRPRHLAISRSR